MLDAATAALEPAFSRLDKPENPMIELPIAQAVGYGRGMAPDTPEPIAADHPDAVPCLPA